MKLSEFGFYCLFEYCQENRTYLSKHQLIKEQQPPETPNISDEMDNDKSIVTADKIIEKSKQWSLEGDCTLLQWMDQISKNLEDRVSKTSFALNEVATKLDRTSVALSNATNNLAALQYSQFVENRVHDDDETLANISEVPNPVTDVTDHKDVNHNIYSFLKKNLEMMNSCHEAYSISYDDSDEDEPATNVVYRSKNPYEARSLPHIYGSTLWKEKWHIGLCDSDNDFSGDEQSEQFSESSSTADDSYESTAPTMSEWDSTAWGLNKNHLIEREEVHTPSNDGESSYQGENYSQSEVSTPRAQRSLPITQPIQDQRYYQHVPRKEENLFDDIFTDSEQRVATQVPTQVVAAPQPRISQEILTSNEPPPDLQPVESDNSRRIGAKKPLNLFDDDEFSSFMDQIVQTATNKNTNSSNPPEEKQEPPKRAVVPNLFDDSDDIFIPKVTDQAIVARKEVSPRLEDDIFMPPPLPKVVEKIRTRNLFDDDDDDDDFESMFASKPSGSNKFTQKTKNLFEDDLGDLAEESPKEKQVVEKISAVLPKEQALPKEALVKEVPLMRKGLFDDDDEDDLLKEKDIFARRPVKKDLFEDIFSKDKPIKSISGQKSDLFSDVEQVSVSKEVTTKQEQPGENANKVSSSIKTDLFADVFRDEPADDIFAPSSSKKKTKVADIFADDFTDDFEEFIPKAAADDVKEEVPTTAPKLPDIGQKPTVPIIDKKYQDDVIPSLPVDLKPTSALKLADIARKPIVVDRKGEDEAILAHPTAAEKPTISPKSLDATQKPLQDEFKPEDENINREVDASVSENARKGDVPSIQTENSTADVKDTGTNLFEESPQITETSEVKKQPTIAVPSYTTLFDDEPPSDDEDPMVPSYEEPAKYPADEDVIVNTPPVAPYSNINLFADVPPDDDDFPSVPPAETKRIHSIFYDDFHETIEASRGEMRAPSTYIFNDEPPPDDDLQSLKVVHEDKAKIVEEKKDRPKVSKLKKTDLKINVGALLPTAKIPLFKKPEIMSESVSGSPKEDYVPSKVSSIKSPEKRDLPENILPNLNRDRAKVQVKRRPSTRKGRQESYRKSMIEEEITAEQGQDEEEKLKKSTSLFEDFGKFAPIASKEVFPTITTVKPKTDREPLFKEPDAFIKKFDDSLVSKSSSAVHPSSATSSVFEDSVSDAGNIFETLRSNKEKPTAATKVLDSLFDSDGVDENPFGSPTKSLTEPIPSKPTEPTKTISQLLSQVESKSAASVSLFEESDSAEEIQSVVAPPTRTAFKPPEEPVKQAPKSSSLFGESDDGSDDIFKEYTKAPKKPAQQKIVEKKPKAKPISQPTKPSSSLFSSDEESASGDDIFGKSKTKVAPKKIEAAKTKPSSSLFADLSDDDDDDLFGTTKKKPSGVEKSKSKPSTTNLQPMKTSAQAQQQTATSNNPLSDLLSP